MTRWERLQVWGPVPVLAAVGGFLAHHETGSVVAAGFGVLLGAAVAVWSGAPIARHARERGGA